MRGIHHHLCIGDIVQGRDQPVDDSQLLLNHLYDRRNAIGRAGSGGDQVVHSGIVQVIITSHHNI